MGDRIPGPSQSDGRSPELMSTGHQRCVPAHPLAPTNSLRQLIDAFGLPAIRRSLMAFDTRKAVLCEQRVSHPLAPTNSLRQLIDAFGLLPGDGPPSYAAPPSGVSGILCHLRQAFREQFQREPGDLAGRRNLWHL